MAPIFSPHLRRCCCSDYQRDSQIPQSRMKGKTTSTTPRVHFCAVWPIFLPYFYFLWTIFYYFFWIFQIYSAPGLIIIFKKKKNIVMAVIITVIAICGSLSGLLIMIVIIFTVIYQRGEESAPFPNYSVRLCNKNFNNKQKKKP